MLGIEIMNFIHALELKKFGVDLLAPLAQTMKENYGKLLMYPG